MHGHWLLVVGFKRWVCSPADPGSVDFYRLCFIFLAICGFCELQHERTASMGVTNITKSIGSSLGPLVTGFLAANKCVKHSFFLLALTSGMPHFWLGSLLACLLCQQCPHKLSHKLMPYPLHCFWPGNRDAAVGLARNLTAQSGEDSHSAVRKRPLVY